MKTTTDSMATIAAVSPARIEPGNRRDPLYGVIRSFTARWNPAFHRRKHFQVCRNNAAIILRRCGRARKRPAVDKFQFEQCCRLHDVLDARWIINTGKLNQDFVLAGTAVLLNDSFTDTELIDTIADRIDGLIDGLITIDLFLSRFESHRVSVGDLACCRDQIPFRKTFIQNPPEIRIFRGINTDSLKCVVLGASQLPENDILALELLSKPLDRLVGLRAYRIVGNDLQHQMGTASEVQAQVDSLFRLGDTRRESRKQCDRQRRNTKNDQKSCS